jgi:hypothetical protein
MLSYLVFASAVLSIDPSHGNGYTKESGYGFDWIREVFAVLREALVGTAGSCVL